MTTTHYPPNWRVRLLTVLNAPVTDENMRFLKAWGLAEGGSAAENPLNTTYPLPWGATSYNSSQVKNYYDPTAGVCANALTLIDDRYDTITTALRQGTHTAEEIVGASRTAIKTWGTNPDTILHVLETLS